MSQSQKNPTSEQPWRDPSRYTNHKRCLGCGRPGGGPWGAWCHPCNVERIERIDASFEAIQQSLRALAARDSS